MFIKCLLRQGIFCIKVTYLLENQAVDGQARQRTNICIPNLKKKNTNNFELNILLFFLLRRLGFFVWKLSAYN